MGPGMCSNHRLASWIGAHPGSTSTSSPDARVLGDEGARGQCDASAAAGRGQQEAPIAADDGRLQVQIALDAAGAAHAQRGRVRNGRQQQRVVTELPGVLYRCLLVEPGGAGDQEHVQREHTSGDEGGVGQAGRDAEGDVGFAQGEGEAHLGEQDLDHDARVALLERSDERGEQGSTELGRGRDPHMAGQGLGTAHGGGGFGEQSQGMASPLAVGAACLGGAHAAATAVQQHDAKTTLQVGDTAADRALALVKRRGSSRDRALVDDLAEGSKVVQVPDACFRFRNSGFQISHLVAPSGNLILEHTPKESPMSSNKARSVSLWIVQILLALAFAAAGTMKALTPLDQLTQSLPWTASMPHLARFIGTCELMASVGLVLPTALRVLPKLTGVAGAALALVMTLALGFHISRGEFAFLPVPLTLGLLAAFVAWGRLKGAPIAPRAYQTSGASRQVPGTRSPSA